MDDPRTHTAATSLDITTDAFTVSRDGTPTLTRKQTRSRAYAAPSRAVRYPAESDDAQRDLAGGTLLASRRDAVLTGLTAARHLDLPLPPRLAFVNHPTIEIAVRPGSAHPDRRGVRGRRLRLPPEHLTTHRGLPTTNPGRTWLDCAAFLSVEHCIAMGDAILARSWATSAQLEALVHWARRRRGVLTARAALPMLDGDSASPGESLVRAHLVLGGLPRPLCNYDVVWEGGWIARVDLCWLTERVIVEYDGAVHLSDRQRKRDAQRRNLLQEAGWLVITLTAADLERPWLMVGQVRRALLARGLSLPTES